MIWMRKQQMLVRGKQVILNRWVLWWYVLVIKNWYKIRAPQFYWEGPTSKLRVVLSANIISTFTKPCIAAEELKSIGHKIGLQTCLYILKIDKVRLNLLTCINYITLFAQLMYSFCPQKPFLSNKISERNASYHAAHGADCRSNWSNWLVNKQNQFSLYIDSKYVRR